MLYTVCPHYYKHVVAISAIHMAFLADVRIALVESLGAGAHVPFEASRTSLLFIGYDREL